MSARPKVPPVSRLSFWKMSGSGNDFVVVDNRRRRVAAEQAADLARRLCARGFSVGADGLILIERSREADFAWRFHNADGSEAAMCGNGGRCAARFAFLKGIAPARMRFVTGAGIVSAEVKGASVKLQLPLPHGYRASVPLEALGRSFEPGFIVVGVPHAVVAVGDLEAAPVEAWGRALRRHEAFAPAGTNVNFFRLAGPGRLAVRTYERGVEGETMACGTGSVASALVAAAAGLVASPVTVATRGGEELVVHFSRRPGGDIDAVFLEGKAEVVYEGKLWEEPAVPTAARGRTGKRGGR